MLYYICIKRKLHNFFSFVLCCVHTGSFKKGHSDKGHHEIHKGDKSEKNEEFFDEDGDEAYDEGKGDISIFHSSIIFEIISIANVRHPNNNKIVLLEFCFIDSYHEDYGKKKGGSFKKGHKKGFVLRISSISSLWSEIFMKINWKFWMMVMFCCRYHDEEKAGKKGGGKKGHHDEDEKGKQCEQIEYICALLFYSWWLLNYWIFCTLLGWHSKKGDEGEYGHKSEHGKKGGDEKSKKWGSKKGH